MNVKIIIAGIVFIIILAVTGFFSSKRKIVMSPAEVHMLNGQTVQVTAVAMRKKAWSYSYKPETNRRQFTFSYSGSRVYAFTSPSAPTSNASGIATIRITSAVEGTGGLTCEAASSRAGKKYGPSTIQVHVHSDASSLPKGKSFTPVVEEETE